MLNSYHRLSCAVSVLAYVSPGVPLKKEHVAQAGGVESADSSAVNTLRPSSSLAPRPDHLHRRRSLCGYSLLRATPWAGRDCSAQHHGLLALCAQPYFHLFTGVIPSFHLSTYSQQSQRAPPTVPVRAPAKPIPSSWLPARPALVLTKHLWPGRCFIMYNRSTHRCLLGNHCVFTSS